jgi:hypothetical protein
MPTSHKLSLLTHFARALHHLPRRPLRVAFFLRSNSNLYEQVGNSLIQFPPLPILDSSSETEVY